MGLFRKLGKQVEEFTQATKAAAEESAEYRCEACDERLHADHDQCPECGAEAVVPVETTE